MTRETDIWKQAGTDAALHLLAAQEGLWKEIRQAAAPKLGALLGEIVAKQIAAALCQPGVNEGTQNVRAALARVVELAEKLGVQELAGGGAFQGALSTLQRAVAALPDYESPVVTLLTGNPFIDLATVDD